MLIDKITKYVEDNIGQFHTKRLERLETLSLSNLLSRKNPYLFKAKNIDTSEMIVRWLADSFLSSAEETIFGDWLEGLAIFINGTVYKGWKSSTEGIDLEFDKEKIRYIVSIKSGPNWGNSSQIKKMQSDFTKAQKIIRTSNSLIQIVAINGCCYGRDNKPDKGNYFKYCGQRFWQFISGDEELYTKIIEPLGSKTKERNENYTRAYNQMINKFNKEFLSNYSDKNGIIDWVTILRLNSGIVRL